MEVQSPQQSSISLQMSSPKHMDIKVNSNVMPYNSESPKHNTKKAYFANTYQILSGSPGTLNKLNLNSYSHSPVKKSSPLVKLMDAETVQTTSWNNYTNPANPILNNNIKMNINNNNLNCNSIITDHSLSPKMEKMNIRNNLMNNESLDHSFIDIKNIKKNSPIIDHASTESSSPSSDFFMKKSMKNLFENKTTEKNLSQLSYQLSKASLTSPSSSPKSRVIHSSEDKLKDETTSTNFKSLDTEVIADIVFKKQEVQEVEKMNANVKTTEKMNFQKSLLSCQLSLSPKEKMNSEGGKKNIFSSSVHYSPKKSSLTEEDFESTKVIKENARKMLLSTNTTATPEATTKKYIRHKSVKFSGENEECPFRRFEAPVSVTTSPIFLVNSTIKPFLETRCNLTTFTEFKQRMIIRKPILIEKAGLLIEENEKTNSHLAHFIKNADVKKEHGVFKSRPSHVPYAPSTATPFPLFSSSEKDKIRVVIQVQNLAYHKEIYVRYTFNNWQTSKDVSATYLNSLNVTSYISKKFHDSTSIYPNASTREKNTTGIDDSAESKIVSQSVDRFVADIEIPSYIMDFMDYDHDFFSKSGSAGDDFLGGTKDRRRYSQSLGEEWDNDIINKCTLKFAAFYRVNDQEYWENNNNMNYTIDISRVLYIPTKKVYTRSRTPELIKSRMVNFNDAFHPSPIHRMKTMSEGELKSILKKSAPTSTLTKEHDQSLEVDEPISSGVAPAMTTSDRKLLAKFELREKCIRETIQKELSGTTFFKQIGVNPTILNTIINSNRVSTRNNILKMIMYYQRKAGITNPIFIPLEKETSTKIEGQS